MDIVETEFQAEINRARQSEKEGWRYAKELEVEIDRLRAEVAALKAPAGMEPVVIVRRGVNAYSILDATGLSGYDVFPDGTALYSAAQLAQVQRERDAYEKVAGQLASFAQHRKMCSWATPLPTGEGYWGCDCGLDALVLDGELIGVAMQKEKE